MEVAPVKSSEVKDCLYSEKMASVLWSRGLLKLDKIFYPVAVPMVTVTY